MKKRNIIVAILVAILVVTFIAGAIISSRSSEAERIKNVVSSFLAGDYIWDESHEELVNPKYIEIYHDKNFFVIFPIIEEDEFYIFYSPEYNGKANFFVSIPSSSKMKNTDLVEDIMDICKALKAGTCYLKTSEGAVLIENIRVTRDGTLYALDNVSGKWHKNVAMDDFILA